jgi:hypothetical protein
MIAPEQAPGCRVAEEIRRFSGDPVQSIVSLFKAEGAGGGSPLHFLF